MNLLSAIRLNKWVKRRQWPDWIHIDSWLKYPTKRLTYNDLIAEDWEPNNDVNISDDDDAVIRFSMIEID